MKEIWKDIPNYEDLYQASNLGRIKRKKDKIYVVDNYHKRKYHKKINEKIIKQFYDDNGYLTANINHKRIRVHRLIAQTFIPNPKNKPVVNHINGKKDDNRTENLEWATYSENSIHAIKTGLVDLSYLGNYRKIKKVLMLDDNNNILKEFNSVSDAFRYFGIKYRGAITETCQGKRKHFKGYRWKYVFEE